MHLESDYGRMIGGCFANASAASPPAVYFANSPPISHLLSTRTNIMGLCLSKRHWCLFLYSASANRFCTRFLGYPGRAGTPLKWLNYFNGAISISSL